MLRIWGKVIIVESLFKGFCCTVQHHQHYLIKVNAKDKFVHRWKLSFLQELILNWKSLEVLLCLGNLKLKTHNSLQLSFRNSLSVFIVLSSFMPVCAKQLSQILIRPKFRLACVGGGFGWASPLVPRDGSPPKRPATLLARVNISISALPRYIEWKYAHILPEFFSWHS